MSRVTTGSVEFDTVIRDWVEQEKECDRLFEEIKNGKGEASLRYLVLRDSCKDMRSEILRSAKSVGLTRKSIKQEMTQARQQAATLYRA